MKSFSRLLAITFILCGAAQAQTYDNLRWGVNRVSPSAADVCAMNGPLCLFKLGTANLNTNIMTLLLPTPTLSVLGGVFQKSCPMTNFINAIGSDGTPSCAVPTTGSGSAPGGSVGQIQFNSAGSFGGFTPGGDLSFNSGTGAFTVANGAITNAKMAAGAAVANIGFTPLNPANNLSEVVSASTARTNLGLGTIATLGSAASGSYLTGTWPSLSIASGVVTSGNMASGAVVANLGYTPVNQAGDTMAGQLVVNTAGSSLRLGTSLSNGAYIWGDVARTLGFGSGAHYNGSVAIADTASAASIALTTSSMFFYANTGLTPGNSYTPTQRLGVDGAGNVTANSFIGSGAGLTGITPFGFYRPETYSSNIASAATAASTAIGGVSGAVRFFGSYTLGASFTLPNGQVWDGSDSGAVPFSYTPTTGSAITLIGDNSALRSAVITQSGSPTTSIGLQVGNGEQGQHPVARDVTVTGFTTGIDLHSNVLRKLDNVTVNTSGTTGVRTRNTVSADSGDDFWSGLTISNATGVGTQNVLYEGGGGLKVVGMKSLGSQIGFNVAMPDGAATQDLQYGLSSIENASVACMKFGRTGTTGSLGLITITGSEFAGCPYAAWFANGGVTTAYFGGNAMSNIATAGIRLDNGANNIVIGPNAYSTVTPIIDNRTDFNEDGYIDRDTVRGFSGVTAANQNLYQIVIPAFRSAKLTFFIEGIAQGYAAFGYSAEYILRNNGGNIVATPIYTPVTDPTGPAAVVTTLDVATTAGSVYVGIKSSGGGITQLQGTFTMKLDGKVQQVNKL